MMKPQPLTPADSDLSDFSFMPFEVDRFRRSDLVTQEEPEVIVAAILLWAAAWHSKPAASLTNDDRSLANAAGFGRAVEAFRAVKEAALRGFVLCSDGRLYHPVVAEKAREAWEAKLKRLWRTECARIRKHNERAREKGHDEEECPSFEDWRAARYVAAMSQATSEDVTRDKSDKSRATKSDSHARQAENVTRDDEPAAPAQAPAPDLLEDLEPALVHDAELEHEQAPLSHATTSNVERDNEPDSRGRVTRDRDRDRDRETLDDYAIATSSTGDDDFPSLDLDEARTEPSAPEPEPQDPLDLVARVNVLATKAGLNVTVPSKLIAAIEQLKTWEGMGFNFETTILPTIERVTRENPSEPVYSLRYFDAAVRKAGAIAGDPLAKPAKPRAPKPPIEARDADDERVGKYRRRLKYQFDNLGLTGRYEAAYSPEHVAVRIVDDKFVEVMFRTAAERSLAITGRDEQPLANAARSLGLELITKDLKA